MSETEIATDIWGDEWRVHDSRETPYGFAVKLGSHVQECRGTRALIATDPLVEFLLERPESTVRALELPLSTSAVWQLRRRLGIARDGSKGKWWEDESTSCGRSGPLWRKGDSYFADAL